LDFEIVIASNKNGVFVANGNTGLFCLEKLRRFEPVKIIASGQWQHDLILQVGEIEHRHVGRRRPIRQIRTLLQNKIGRRNEPTKSKRIIVWNKI
jgi:hypothetical protein